jgi:hypothetical protein
MEKDFLKDLGKFLQSLGLGWFVFWVLVHGLWFMRTVVLHAVSREGD